MHTPGPYQQVMSGWRKNGEVRVPKFREWYLRHGSPCLATASIAAGGTQFPILEKLPETFEQHAAASYRRHCGPKSIELAEGDLLGELITACRKAYIEIAALTPDPANGACSDSETWPQLSNPADRECISTAFCTLENVLDKLPNKGRKGESNAS